MVHRCILVVDNEEYIQEVAKLCLEMASDWQVITAGSGREAIRRAEADQPDAILLDVMMPDMDGFATLQNLKANPLTQLIPVILLSADIYATDQRHYQNLGLITAIAKPFDPLGLATQVATALNWPLTAEAASELPSSDPPIYTES